MARLSCGTIAVGASKADLQVRAVLAALLLHGAAASAEMTWPTVAMPQGIASFAMGGELSVNGLPLRMRGVLSDRPPAQVAALFRASLGQPLVETAQGAKLVMGRALGEFYATVQLEPAGTGTRGVVAVTRLSAALGARAAIKESGQRVLSHFPAGSRLVTQMSSVDGTRRADFLTLSNNLDVEFNVGYIKHTLDADGYTLERATSPIALTNGAVPQNGRAGTTLFFKRRDAEAVAMIYRDTGGDTAIVLNTVTALEHAK